MNPSCTISKTGYWQDLSRRDKLKKLTLEGYLADCKFVVGPEDKTAETIYGHKIVYIMESPVFEKMFTGDFVEAQDKSEIRVTDVNPRDFKNLSCMIYSKCASNLNALSMDDIFALYRLCDKYMISLISQLCINHMKNSKYLDEISTDNLITLFEFSRDLEDKSLLQSTRMTIQQRCTTISITSRTDILTEEPFYDFVKTLSESSYSYYGGPSAKELHIFSVVNLYFVNNNLLKILNNDIEKDSNSKIEHISKKIKKDESMDNSKKSELTTKNSIKNLLKNLLKLIQFGEMSVSDFQNGPGFSKLLDNKQKYYILSFLNSKCLCGHNNSTGREKCRHVSSNTHVILYK